MGPGGHKNKNVGDFRLFVFQIPKKLPAREGTKSQETKCLMSFYYFYESQKICHGAKNENGFDGFPFILLENSKKSLLGVKIKIKYC